MTQGLRVNRLRHRLIAAFFAATILPFAAAIWIGASLLDRSLGYATTGELDRLSRTLEATVRQFYQREREALKQDALAGRTTPTMLRRGRHRRDGPSRFARSGRAARPSGSASPGPAAIISTICAAPAVTAVSGVEAFSRDLARHPDGGAVGRAAAERASWWNRSKAATCGAASR